MELRHLRYFIAVAEELHVGRAATRLHIAQPPLSQQIRRLEEDLGVQLFSRAGRGIELTHAGEVFLPEARQILRRTERAGDIARRAESGQIGPLSICCGPLGASSVLTRVLPVFREHHPTVDVNLREALPSEIVEALHDRSVDLGLLLPHSNSELLRSEPLFPVPLLAALPKKHLLARRRTISIKELAGEKFVVVSRELSAGFYEQVLGCCLRAGFTPNVIEEATQVPTLLVMVAAGYGVSLVPAIAKSASSSDVALLPIDDSCPPLQLSVVWRGDNASPVLSAFLSTLRALYPFRRAKRGKGTDRLK